MAVIGEVHQVFTAFHLPGVWLDCASIPYFDIKSCFGKEM